MMGQTLIIILKHKLKNLKNLLVKFSNLRPAGFKIISREYFMEQWLIAAEKMQEKIKKLEKECELLKNLLGKAVTALEKEERRCGGLPGALGDASAEIRVRLNELSNPDK
jgi:hypothetical protein